MSMVTNLGFEEKNGFCCFVCIGATTSFTISLKMAHLVGLSLQPKIEATAKYPNFHEHLLQFFSSMRMSSELPDDC